MDNGQRIDFEQGSLLTGDSGERGDATEGVDSIKPVDDGERAVSSNFDRPLENLRQRSEFLRDSGEQQLYLQDSDMRWVVAPGGVDGLAAAAPWPTVNWDYTTGTFVTINDMVLQPLNTPATDQQETKVYTFTQTTPSRTANVNFTPLADKRAYNTANLINIVWVEDTAANLASAIVPGKCDGVISGDPEHVLTLTIVDDGTADTNDLLTVLSTLATTVLSGVSGELGDIGLGYLVDGADPTNTTMDYADIPVADQDYQMRGTYERELHYITPAAFAAFFGGGGNQLTGDGDTLSIEFTDFDRRRQSIPLNSGAPDYLTTVDAADLFITTANAERIPVAIPICKRIGDDLLWLDGTIILAAQTGTPILPGENGHTVDRITNGATAIQIATYVDPSPETNGPIGLTSGTLQANMEAIVRGVNERGNLSNDETVNATRYFVTSMDAGDVGYQITAQSTLTGSDSASNDFFGSRVVVQSAIVGDAVDELGGMFSQVILASGSHSLVRGLHSVVEDSGSPSVSSIRGIDGSITIDSTTSLFSGVTGLKLDTLMDTSTGNVEGVSTYVQVGANATVGGTLFGIENSVEIISGATISAPEVVGLETKINTGSDASLAAEHISYRSQVNRISNRAAQETYTINGDTNIMHYRTSATDTLGSKVATASDAIIASLSFQGVNTSNDWTTSAAIIVTQEGAAATSNGGDISLYAYAPTTPGDGAELHMKGGTSFVGVNSISPRTSLTVGGQGAALGTGAISFDPTLYSTDQGSTVDVTNRSVVALSNGSQTTPVTSIAGGADGQVVFIVNRTGLVLTFSGVAGGPVVANLSGITIVRENSSWYPVS